MRLEKLIGEYKWNCSGWIEIHDLHGGLIDFTTCENIPNWCMLCEVHCFEFDIDDKNKIYLKVTIKTELNNVCMAIWSDMCDAAGDIYQNLSDWKLSRDEIYKILLKHGGNNNG